MVGRKVKLQRRQQALRLKRLVTNNIMYRQENELYYCSCTVLYSCFIQVKEFKYKVAFSDMYRYRFPLIRACHSSKKLLTRSENAPALLIHEGNKMKAMSRWGCEDNLV